jgi:hypothetical protein
MSVQIIKENRKPSTGERFSQAFEKSMSVLGKYQEKQAEANAYKQMGLDPSIGSLPKEAQAEYFKNAFTKEKGLTSLQEAQKNLAEAKLRDLEETQGFEKKLRGNQTPVDPNQTDAEYSKTKIPDLDMSEDELEHYAGYAGQPGKRGVVGNIAKSKKEKQEKEAVTEQKRFEADREFHTKVSRPIIDAANETLKTQSIKKGLTGQLRRDIASGNTSGIFPFLVDKMGLESFRNPESARFTNEVKNLFVESINDIPGARPNMFMERLLSAAQPMIGRSEEANLSVLDVGDFIDDIKAEQARQEIALSKEDREKFGYAKEDITERARDRMGDYVNKKQEEMAIKIRDRQESSMDNADILNEIIGKTITPGTYVTPRTMKLLFIKNDKDIKKAVKEAESLGMVFPEYMEQ